MIKTLTKFLGLKLMKPNQPIQHLLNLVGVVPTYLNQTLTPTRSLSTTQVPFLTFTPLRKKASLFSTFYSLLCSNFSLYSKFWNRFFDNLIQNLNFPETLRKFQFERNCIRILISCIGFSFTNYRSDSDPNFTLLSRPLFHS